MKQEMSQRIDQIEITRAIAALGVVLCHFLLPVIQPIVSNILFHSMVPFFYIISGYYLARSYLKIVGRDKQFIFIIKRLLLFLMLILVWGVYALLIYSIKEDVISGRSLLHFIKRLLGVNLLLDNLPLWYMRDLIVYVTLAPLLLRIPRYILLFVTVICLGMPMQMFTPFHYPQPEYLGYFTLGLCLFRFQEIKFKKLQESLTSSNSNKWILILFIGVSVLFIILRYFNVHGAPYTISNLPTFRIGTVIALLLLGASLQKCSFFNKVLLRISLYNVLIYVSHYPLLTVWQSYVNELKFGTILEIIISLLFIPCFLLLCDLTYRLVQRCDWKPLYMITGIAKA